METNLMDAVKKYVEELFNEKSDARYTYHTYDHTSDVAKAAATIGKGNHLGDEDLENVILAAWFHDTGYLTGRENHEQESARVAGEFLKSQNCPDSKIQKVTSLIFATQINHVPANLPEEVIRDADYANLGNESNFKKSKLLRDELANFGSPEKSEDEWLRNELNFLKNHSWYTAFAKEKFGDQKSDNIKKFKKKLKKHKEKIIQVIREKPEVDPIEKEKRKLEEKKEKEERELKKEIEKKENLSVKGFESIFRLTSSNHMRMNAIADRKASLMLSLSGIIISVSMSMLAGRFDKHWELIIPTCLLVTSSLVTIVFATLSTRPKVNSGLFKREDIENKKANLLFFGNFAQMNLEDFDWGLRRMSKDTEYLHNSMIQDFYFLGKVLYKKFWYLRICYNVFMFGIIISVLAFAAMTALKYYGVIGTT